MPRTLEDRLLSRARKGYALACASRADALARECSARTARTVNRKEGAARRSLIQALRLADEV